MKPNTFYVDWANSNYTSFAWECFYTPVPVPLIEAGRDAIAAVALAGWVAVPAISLVALIVTLAVVTCAFGPRAIKGYVGACVSKALASALVAKGRAVVIEKKVEVEKVEAG